MISGLMLLYVGAVLFVNGVWMLGRIGDREVAVINILVGSLSFLVASWLVFHDPGDERSINAGAFSFLFAFTYLWVGANQFLDSDGRGLGWFSLFVSITAAVVGINSLLSESSLALWSSLNWLAWALLWFGFFLLLALGRDIKRLVAIYTLFCAVFTGWMPGIMVLEGMIRL